MEYELKQRLLSYFSSKEKMSKDEKELLKLMKREVHQYDVLTISKQTLSEMGYDEFKDCDHKQMNNLAALLSVVFEGTYLPLELDMITGKEEGLW